MLTKVCGYFRHCINPYYLEMHLQGCSIQIFVSYTYKDMLRASVVQ